MNSKVKCKVKDEVKGETSDKVEISAQPGQYLQESNGMDGLFLSKLI